MERNNSQLPDHIIFYRDGVGEQMRKAVLKVEVDQFREAIKERYNTLSIPALTVIFVNKRISQRFFHENDQGNLVNPPSGSLVDTCVVENRNPDEYDFYLVPQTANQGCVIPTHFYVAYNDSKLPKAVLE